MKTKMTGHFPSPQPPKGWILRGDCPQSYEAFLDSKNSHLGRASGALRSIAKSISGFGTLMQMAGPGDWTGKRIRLNGWIKTRDVVNWSGLWLRVDGPGGKMLGFDNMQNRAISGTHDWAKYEIVLDVPATAIALGFGLILAGTGQCWIDDLSFQIVNSRTKVTGYNGGRFKNPPRNLDFEE